MRLIGDRSHDATSRQLPADQAIGQTDEPGDVVHVDRHQRQFDHHHILGEVGEHGEFVALGGGEFGQLVVPRQLIGERARAPSRRGRPDRRARDRSASDGSG